MTKKNKEIVRASEIFPSPYRLVIRFLITILLVDILLEFLLDNLPPISHVSEALIEGFGMILLLIPAVYFFIYRPMINFLSERLKDENEKQVLSEIVHGVTESANLEELLKLIHNSLRKVLYSENCFFALHDEETGLFSFPYFVDKYDTTPAPVEMAKSCTSYVFNIGQSMLINQEVFNQLKVSGEVELVGSVSPSWIGVPLKASQRVIGVLVLQHYEEENAYTDEHLRFLDSIGSQVANVIERKRAEKLLEKSVSLLTATLESTADAILVVSKNGKITNFNKKFIEFWKIPDSIIATKDDEAFLTYVLNQLKEPELFLQKVKELYSNEEETSSDIIEFNDGRVFERYSQSQHFEGKCVGRVWSFHDITVRRNALNALKESEARLRELNATKDKFFTIIAHDLKNPFNSILGLSDLLVDQIKTRDYNGIEEYAKIIRQSSQRAFDLLLNLLEWSRSQTGSLEFTPQQFDLVLLVNEVFEFSNVSAKQKLISFTCELPENAFVFADKSMIGSVVRNLISNAIKFTNPGGKVTISVQQNPVETTFSVKDNGVGISKYAFDKLFRIDESYSTVGTKNEMGTGLGLILCHDFIQRNGGRIWLESEHGSGSKFSFNIPVPTTLETLT